MAQRAPQTGNPSARSDMFARKSANPFFNDDDEANDSAGGSSRSGQSRRSAAAPTSRSSNPWQTEDSPSKMADEPEERLENDLMTQIQASRGRQLDSTRKALQNLYESEQLGVATAEELSRQGEKLNNVELRLDSMNSTLNQTQRHLNNVKSIFGGISNWLAPKPKGGAPAKPGSAGVSASQPVGATGDRPGTSGGLQKSKSDYSGFFEQEAKAADDPHEREINQNLSEMSTGIGRLKSLAEGLNGELERQNTQIDRTIKKVDVVKPRLDDQNRQMRQLLGQK